MDEAKEFTGKHRINYIVEVRIIATPQVEHATEGWMPQPGENPRVSERQVLASTPDFDKAHKKFIAVGTSR